MKKTISIDADKCNGCRLCVEACHEGSLGMADGKAVVLHEDTCDGLGDCLPVCPTGAISFESRETNVIDEPPMKTRTEGKHPEKPSGACPGSNVKTFIRKDTPLPIISANRPAPIAESELNQWPVQLKLAPTTAPYFDWAKLLIAADCSAYAYANFHSDFIKGKITLIGCPKLDAENYADKLTAILKKNTIRSVTIVRMEVPCCAGIEQAAVQALKNCGKMIPWEVITLAVNGEIVE